MKHVIFILFSFFFYGTIYGQVEKNKMQWWKEAKFGMFMHWGLYSQTAGYWNGHLAKGAEHFMLHERIPWLEYGKIANDFNPVNYDADRWVEIAKNAGMKYLIITAKHHDGFAMYNSPSSDYNIVKLTPYGKDPMKQLADACHKQGIKFGFYYSLGRDWQDPDVPTNWPVKAGRSNTWDFPDEDAKVFNRYFERKVKPQIRELLTQYGKIDILWFDTSELISKAESQELVELIHQIQPDCIINNRIGNRLGDYTVREQELNGKIDLAPWEACITMSKNWGYIKYDTLYKSSELLIHQLLDVVSKGGNYLLNTGPTSKGEITQEAQARLIQIGKWLIRNSEGIYGTSPWIKPNEYLTNSGITVKSNVKKENEAMNDAINDVSTDINLPDIYFTSKAQNLYAYIDFRNGYHSVIKSLSSTKVKPIKEVTLLHSKDGLDWKQTEDGLEISIPDINAEKMPIIGIKIGFH
jgi:alpha-L-fucosidase